MKLGSRVVTANEIRARHFLKGFEGVFQVPERFGDHRSQLYMFTHITLGKEDAISQNGPPTCTSV
jgi:hypothetical protein